MNSAPIEPFISTPDLDKIERPFRNHLTVEDVANSETLVWLRVDFGDHAR